MMTSTALRVAFFGTPEFATHSLKALLDHPGIVVPVVVTQPDRPAGRGKRLTPSPVKGTACERDIPVLQPEHLRRIGEAFLDELRVHGPLDGAVVVAFGQIIPDFLLHYFSGRCVNVHASLLPRWRGAAPIQRALMEGDHETGVCLMKMESGLDTGPVYSREIVPITSNDTLESLHDTLAKAGASLLSRDIERILRGECEATPQPEEGVTYAQKITADDALIRWNRTAEEIARTVRALWPAPGAFTWIDGKRLKLARVERREESAEDVPGTVVTTDEGRCTVACGEGTLSLQEVQLEGKQRMGIGEFLRGYPVRQGMVLSERNR